MNHDQAELRNQVQELYNLAKDAHVDGFEIAARLESGFLATARMGDIENLEHHREKALTISVYKNQRTGSASTSDLSKNALAEILKKACFIAEQAEPDEYAGLPDKNLIAFDYPDLELDYAWSLTPEEALHLALEADKTARALDSRIIQTEESMVSTARRFKVYANSHGFFGSFPSSSHGHSISVVAEQNGEMERDYDHRYSHLPSDLLTPQALAESAVTRALQRLGSRKIATQRCPVIFEKRVAKSLIGHFIGAIGGVNLYRRTTFLVDQMGELIFPEFINIDQRPHLKSGYGSAPFDGQCVRTKAQHYIADGRLTNYVLGNYSAKKLGLVTTGNAGGVFNLFVSHSDQDLQSLCRSMGTGLLVTELMGQGVNTMTGDYSRGAAGFWVENGEIQFPVSEVTIASNLKEMFANIVAIANDAEALANIHVGSMLIKEMTVAGTD